MPMSTQFGSLSIGDPEQCGMFWLSVASMIAWPTFLTLVTFIYSRGSVTYTKDDGGKFEYSMVLGTSPASPTQHAPMEPSNGGQYYLSYTEAGYGSLALLLDAYPIRNFLWTVNSNETIDSSVQLVRRALGRNILPEEEISISHLVVTSIDFILRLVGLLLDRENIFNSVRTMFTGGVVPDIRVFLLGSTIASVMAFMLGTLTCLFTASQPSARKATRKTRLVLAIVWDILCLVSFAVGCWQIDSRRRAHQSIWPMFIYWTPSTSFIGLRIFGFNVSKVLGMIGVVLGVIARNELVCYGRAYLDLILPHLMKLEKVERKDIKIV
ncbi:hypothetical protein Clacol_000219 [Clathrus columnatus]|uniref:Uncharacterized protein n=1 Tax=Clathrus columnatus TaxID=1419009 RepID=A0AAV4ZWE1_9AGAM|nr:hypothetical protein Clacol_000219 [Clathrus columnatus]